ncbi:MAG: hypothetical protein ACREO1_06110, partial [Arenimonas sp.]
MEKPKLKSTSYKLRVPVELLEHWKAFAERHGETPQAALRAVMRKLVGEETPPFETPPVHRVNTRRIDRAKKKRLVNHFTVSEFEALEVIANEKQCSKQHWVTCLVRAALTRGVTVGGVELQALADSNYQLMALGRNVNQIVKRMNAEPEQYAQQLDAKLLHDIQQQIKANRQATHAVIASCSERWEITR